MFRRFMIVCWVLFSIFTLVGVISYIGYQVTDGPEFEVALPSGEVLNYEEMTDAQKEQAEDVVEIVERAERKNREKYLLAAWSGGIPAIVVLLWNIIMHTGHWIWMGRKVE